MNSTTPRPRLAAFRSEVIEVVPILIGAKNAEPMTGNTMRWIVDHADELGVEIIRIGAKSFVVAADLLAALKKRRAATPEPEVTEEDELTAMRARLGKVRRP